MSIMHTVVQRCLQVTIVQLFLTLISLPILVGWGLPLSYLTPVGTILFTPVLTLYLWCCLLVFFTTFLCIPNDFFIEVLSRVSDWWLWMLACIQVPHTIGFVSPPILLLLLIPFTGICAVLYVRKKSLWIIATTLTVVLGMWIGVLSSVTSEHYVSVEHTTNKKKISCYYHNGITTVVDIEGSLSSMIDGASWFFYTVMPTITQQTGATYVDQFVVLHPRQRTFEALMALCKKGVVHDVYVPWWEGTIPARAFYSYMELKKILTVYGYRIYCLPSHKPFIIDLTHVLHATSTHKTYGKATYPLFSIDCNQSINTL
jgi:hypothetical protein